MNWKLVTVDIGSGEESNEELFERKPVVEEYCQRHEVRFASLYQKTWKGWKFVLITESYKGTDLDKDAVLLLQYLKTRS